MTRKKEIWHNLNWQEAVKILGTNAGSGLTADEAEARQKKFGKNVLPEEKQATKLKIFLEQFKSPLIYILLIAAAVTVVLKDYTDAIIILGAVVLNTSIGFFQETKTSKILSELKKITKIKALVIRNGNEKEIFQSELVPGDIFILKPGDKIPADGRLIETDGLKVNESVITGEWLANPKQTETLPEKTPLADRDNMVYLGSIVENGWGKAVVAETGLNTEVGKIGEMVMRTKEEKTPYQKKISRLSKITGVILVIISLLIFTIGITTGKDIFEMFLTSVAVAVAAIPEGLPIAVTVILALGMQRVLKKKGLIRKMVAAETLGSTSIIATDKTGTLTEGKMQIAGIYTGTKELLSDGKKYKSEINKDGMESHILALKISALCNDAFVENPEATMEEWIVRGEPTEKALLLAAIQAGLSKKELEKQEPRISELHFDPISKYSATLRKFAHNNRVLYSLGAPEKIMQMCAFIDDDGLPPKRLTEEKRKELNKKCDELAGKGQRILATAYRKMEKHETDSSPGKLEKFLEKMVFTGFIALHDPIRKEAKKAIDVCRKAGMRPIIVTGDHKLTARAIAAELGLVPTNENIIEGAELEELNDKEFEQKLEQIQIYARVEPKQKLRIVQAWQNKGKVVAMTGDGINDAPALKQADIGVALGSGTDVAKEASDLVLLSDSFSIIVAAVEEGRSVVDNIRKTVTLLLSQCFSELILVGASVIAGLPLPILPAQILWENLIEGSPQGVALAFEPKEEKIMERKPEPPEKHLLNTEMKAIIFGFGILTNLILLALFLWLLKIKMPLAEIRTIIFAALAIDTFFYAFSCRDLNRNIWKYNPFSNKYLVLGVIFSFLMLMAALYIPVFQNLLKTVPLNLFDWFLLLSLGLINLILIEVTKWYFIAKNKNS